MYRILVTVIVVGCLLFRNYTIGVSLPLCLGLGLGWSWPGAGDRASIGELALWE